MGEDAGLGTVRWVLNPSSWDAEAVGMEQVDQLIQG